LPIRQQSARNCDTGIEARRSGGARKIRSAAAGKSLSNRSADRLEASALWQIYVVYQDDATVVTVLAMLKNARKSLRTAIFERCSTASVAAQQN
jgi:hypothetical protein